MQLDQYQSQAMQYAVFPLDSSGWDYILSAIPEEVGEFSSIFAKCARNGRGRRLTAEERTLAIKELGDIIWGAALAARLLETTLENVAQQNLTKLESRARRGQIEGQGDNR